MTDKIATTHHKSTTTKSTAAKSTIDAFDLLKSDHRTVEELFEKFADQKDRRGRLATARKIVDELSVHASIEEEIFYPAARAALNDDADLVDEAAVEHESLRHLMDNLEPTAAADDLFDARVKVLREYVNHHVKEEEKSMFPKLRGKLDTGTLGVQLLKRKQELTGELKPPRKTPLRH